MLLLSSSALAVSQSEYDEVIAQRNALYQQIVDAGLDPVIEISLALPSDNFKSESADSSPSEYQVTEYRWSSSWYYYNDLVIKNTSGQDCKISVSMIFYDKAGNIIGIDEASQYACQNGFETYYSFSNEDPFDHVEYTITMTPEKYYTCIQADLDLQSNIVGDKVILSARNSGDLVMEFVEYHVLYLDDSGTVVGKDWGYIDDSDNEIKPGSTQFKDESCSEDFSSVLFFANGRAD